MLPSIRALVHVPGGHAPAFHDRPAFRSDGSPTRARLPPSAVVPGKAVVLSNAPCRTDAGSTFRPACHLMTE